MVPRDALGGWVGEQVVRRSRDGSGKATARAGFLKKLRQTQPVIGALAKINRGNKGPNIGPWGFTTLGGGGFKQIRQRVE